MEREVLQFSTEAEWLAFREKDVTSTEAAGLFDAGAYEGARTFYELFMIKSGRLPKPTFEATDRMRWGNRLEAAIAAGIAEDYGLIVEPFKVYMRVPGVRMGSSFDFKIIGLADGFSGDQSARDLFKEHGPGILEIKNVDGLQFRRGWIEDSNGIEAPPHIEFQVQHQLEVADLGWSMIAPLVGGNTPKVAMRTRDRELGQLIRQNVATLWDMIAKGTPPKPDFLKDAGVISQLYVNNNGSEIDLSDNDRLIELCTLYKQAGADEKDAKARKDAAKAEILTIVEAAKTIKAGAYKVSAGTNKESYRAYRREQQERWTITKSVIPACDIEATVPPFRNVRISGEAA